MTTSKYEPLWKYLQTNGGQTLRLTFEEIKTITGFDIDHSFLTYKKEASPPEFGTIKHAKKVAILPTSMPREAGNRELSR
jgi:hypothetical protein